MLTVYGIQKTDVDKLERAQKGAVKLITELAKQEALLWQRDRTTRLSV